MIRRLAAPLCAAALIVVAVSPALAQRKGGPKQTQQSTDAEPGQFPVNVPWRLINFNGKQLTGDTPTLFLDGNFRATGFAGCNTWSATAYPVKNQRLAVGAIAVTHKTCPKDVEQAEVGYLVGLHSSPFWKLDGLDLILSIDKLTMRFIRGV